MDLGRLTENIRKRKPTAEILMGDEAAAEWRQKGGWQAAALSIALDVATDPLLYVGVGAGKSAATLARKVAKSPEATRVLGSVDEARKLSGDLLRYGSDAPLTQIQKDALKAMGESTGLAMRVPGTGIPSRAAARLAGRGDIATKMAQKRRVTIAAHDTPIGKAVDAARSGASKAVMRPTRGRRLAQAGLEGSLPKLRAAARAGEEGGHAAQTALDASLEGRGIAEVTVGRARKELNDILADARRIGVEETNLLPAMQGDAPAVARVRAAEQAAGRAQRVGDDLAERLQTWRDDFANFADLAAGNAWMHRTENYAPRIPLANAFERIEVVRSGDPNVRSFLQHRHYVPGEDFMGNTLVRQADDAAGRSVEHQMADIMAAEGIEIPLRKGETAAQAIYRNDFEGVIDTYLRMAQRQIQKEYVANKQVTAGVGITKDRADELTQLFLERTRGRLKGSPPNESADYVRRNEDKLRGLTRAQLEGEPVLEELTLRRVADDLHQRADDLLRQAQRTGDPADLNLAIAADVDAKHAQQIADNLTAKFPTEVHLRQALRSPKAEETITAAMMEGYAQFGSKTMIPADIADMLNATSRLQESGWLKKASSQYDRVLNLWKGYAVMTPGFHWRNTFGSFLNNWMGDVGFDSYKHYLHAARAAKRGKLDAAKLPGEVKDAYRAAENMGVLKGGQSVHEVLSGQTLFSPQSRIPLLSKPHWANPMSTDFFMAKFGRHGWKTKGNHVIVPTGEQIENMMRGSAFIDTFVRTGGDATEAFARTMRLHFDYADISNLERNVLRRFSPFYLWNRRNLSLQLGFIVQEPEKMSRYFKVKNNIEAMSADEDEVPVPSWFLSRQGIRLPSSTRLPGSEHQAYAMPDLPITTLFEPAEVDPLFGHIAPVLRAPVEAAIGQRAFQNIPLESEARPVPRGLAVIPGVVPALERIPGPWRVTRDEGGRPVMHQRWAHVLEENVPVLAQLRRLAPDPDDQRMQDRQIQAWLSFSFGMNFQVAAHSEQRSGAIDRVGPDRFFQRAQHYRRLGYEDDEAERRAIRETM